MSRNAKAFGLIILILVAVPAIVGFGIDDVRLPHNHQGYAPVQPIAFSHRLHAGVLEMNCQYCHQGADESRHATIPSAQTCMNCHSKVDGTTVDGQTNINILRQYYNTNTPIRWIKVHRLPDHAYFNHSAHVEGQKIACQECHGKVEEMAVLSMERKFNMGFCINCHRQKNAEPGSDLHAPLDCSGCHR